MASRPIKDIMTPRPRIKAIDINAPQEQVLETILSEEFSRFPVYRGRLDHIEGIIHTKDIIPYLIRREPIELHRFLRKPYYVPESASVESVLVQMQENAVHLAFVVDEFGNMEGLVTLEDIIEEIVGDIQDEYDVKEEDGWTPAAGRRLGSSRARLRSRTSTSTSALGLPEKRGLHHPGRVLPLRVRPHAAGEGRPGFRRPPLHRRAHGQAAHQPHPGRARAGR